MSTTHSHIGENATTNEAKLNTGAPPMTNGATQHEETGGYQGGMQYQRFITPGGNPIDNSQPAFPIYHRK